MPSAFRFTRLRLKQWYKLLADGIRPYGSLGMKRTVNTNQKAGEAEF